LNNNEPISKSSALKALNPMLGDKLLHHLGGRLRNVVLGYCEKHSIRQTLPRDRISELLIDHAHPATLHGGTQLTLRNLRQEY